MVTSSRAPAPEASEHDALALLDSVRSTLGLPAAVLDLGSAQTARELREAHALLTILVSLVSGPGGTRAHDDARHNWNKALRRRGWSRLPSLDAASPAATRSGATSRPAPAIDPVATAAGQVREFLASFGVVFDAQGCSPRSLAHAHALGLELLRDVDALRALPLLSPESYTRRHADITARWNTLASVCTDLPRLGALDAGSH